MSHRDAIYRIFSYVRHVLTAWNTTGEGIHSPYLFYLVRFLMRDANTYYCFSDIERRRESLLRSRESIEVVDYGSQGSPDGLHVTRKISEIASGQLESARMGQLLFRMLVYMGHEQGRPLEILELGTSLGITTAYLASASRENHVVTLEGSESVVQVARDQWRALGVENIIYHIGKIEDTLYKCAREELDMAYIDANHTYEATMKYAEYLLPRMHEKGVIVVDDIHYSREMARAWEQLKADERVTTTMDLYHAGLLFVDKHYLKRHYRILI